jgi:hypothetical protein
MQRLLFLLLAAATAFASDDPWAKVKALKSGTEIRILKKGATQTVTGKFDEADDDRLIVVLKTEQVAVKKDQIDRVDARPAAGSRVTVTGKTEQVDPTKAKEPRAGMNHEPEGGGTSSSAGLSVGSKPDFETIYRRQLGAPKK